jgi:N-acetylglutamate synthase-like GNAT family acetyltransferase
MPLQATRPPQVRLATEQDWEPIIQARTASINTVCLEHTPTEIAAWIVKGQRQDQRSGAERPLVLVAEQSGDLIGFSQIDLMSGLIHALYVHPDQIGQDVGRSLLLVMQDHARATGLRRITVEATLSSVAFFQARGFLPVRTGSKALADGTTLQCVEMEKPL